MASQSPPPQGPSATTSTSTPSSPIPTLTLTLTLPHYPAYPIHITLFTAVRNAARLRQELLSSNPSFDYAFLDATTILSPKHLLLAAQIALHAHLYSRAKTRTPHSELVFRLHVNNNIGEAYRKFGIQDDSTHVVVVKFGGLDDGVTAESVAEHLGSVVEGRAIELGEGAQGVNQFSDVAKIRKIFKLADGAAKGKGKKGAAAATTTINGDANDEQASMESVIMGIMALKGS